VVLLAPWWPVKAEELAGPELAWQTVLHSHIPKGALQR
jgi:hypothetical protein